MQFVKMLWLLLAVVCQMDATCLHPDTAPNYTNEQYAGLWYEIGRIQTPGGAIFQKNCLCDTANITSSYVGIGDAKVTYACRNYDVHASVTSVSGTLKVGEKAGNFEQSMNPLIPPVDYNVVWLDEDTAMEYDCGKTFFIENYCIHFMSRTTSIEPAKLQLMKDYADKLGLNTKNIKYVPVLQDGCW